MKNDMTDINQIAITSPDGRQERLERLRELFPDLFDGEGQINEKALRTLISDEVGVAAERFTFEWAGKHKSKRFAFSPSKATLQFDAERSVNKGGSPNRSGETLEDNTSENLIIEGDNLEVLKLLQATYFEQVKCIYIDPPYNTGNDFIYPDNFTESKKAYWEKNGAVKEGVKLTALPESHGRRHSNWLNFMQSRLLLARQMLRDDGVIFISIGDDELDNLIKICNEIFSADNRVSIVPRVAKRTSDKGTYFRPTKDYILVYAKNKFSLQEFGVKKDCNPADYKLKDDDERLYKKSGASLYQPSLDSRPNQRYYIEAPDGSLIIPPGSIFPKLSTDGSKVKPLSNTDKVWRWSVDTYKQNKNKLIFTKGSAKNPLVDEKGKQSKWNIYPKVYLDEDEGASLHPEDIIYDYPNSQGTKELLGMEIPFSFSKPRALIQYLIEISKSDKESIILDFFAGSGTSAHAVIQQNAEDGGNRKYIMVQIPELTDEKSEAYKAGYKKISDITIERVKRAGAKIREESPDAQTDTGFRVFKLSGSNFPQNLFSPDPEKSEEENLKALETHLAKATQMRLFDEDEFSNLVTEISLKNGFGLFYELEPVDGLLKNKVYRLIGNDKSALLCLDNDLHDETVEGLKPLKDEQLIVSKFALDTTKKFSLQTEFKDNLWVV